MTRDEAVLFLRKINDIFPQLLPGKKRDWVEADEIRPGFWVVKLWARKWKLVERYDHARPPDMIVTDAASLLDSDNPLAVNPKPDTRSNRRLTMIFPDPPTKS